MAFEKSSVLMEGVACREVEMVISGLACQGLQGKIGKC